MSGHLNLSQPDSLDSVDSIVSCDTTMKTKPSVFSRFGDNVWNLDLKRKLRFSPFVDTIVLPQNTILTFVISGDCVCTL